MIELTIVLLLMTLKKRKVEEEENLAKKFVFNGSDLLVYKFACGENLLMLYDRRKA